MGIKVPLIASNRAASPPVSGWLIFTLERAHVSLERAHVSCARVVLRVQLPMHGRHSLAYHDWHLIKAFRYVVDVRETVSDSNSLSLSLSVSQCT